MYHLAGEAVSGGVGDHVSAAGGGGAVMNNAGELVTLVKLYPGDVHLASCKYRPIRGHYPGHVICFDQSKARILTTVDNLDVSLVLEVNCEGRG